MSWIYLHGSNVWWKLSNPMRPYHKQNIIRRGPECGRCENIINKYPIKNWREMELKHGYLYNNEMLCYYCYQIKNNKNNIAKKIVNREIYSKTTSFFILEI